MLLLLLVLCLGLLPVLLRWERRRFQALGKGAAWLPIRPALTLHESARVAALSVAAVIGVALLAQWLQPVVWSLLRSAGVL
jgi:hypothetical protein